MNRVILLDLGMSGRIVCNLAHYDAIALEQSIGHVPDREPANCGSRDPN